MGAARVALLMVLVSGTPAWADSFDELLEATMAHWRAASWYAHTGNAGVAGIENEAFLEKWNALARKFVMPPDRFARDAAWADTVAQVTASASAAAVALESDDAAGAEQKLHAIGDALAALRARNGVVDLTDHVARYRDAVDALSGLSLGDRLDETRIRDLRALTANTEEAVAVLEKNAPARSRGDAEFASIMRQNRDGVAALAAALSRTDPPSTLEVVGLIRVVRSNYNLLFLRFGAVSPGPSVA